jgi:5-methylcytosine-specific restriction endonuclease McrA
VRTSDLADGRVANITIKAVQAPQCIPAKLMLQEFQDISGQSFHDAFQAWRAANPNGTLLNLDTQTKAKLHGSQCQHFGSTNWSAEPDTGPYSLTRKRKVLGAGAGSLADWARNNGVEVRLCVHCKSDGFVSEADLKAIPIAQQAAPMSVTQVVEAVEGRVREVRSLQHGRNASLRTAALARAKGVCEGCTVDFSRLLAGRGVRVLEVHHKNAISSRTEPSLTKVEELAVLCPNCHALVHLDADPPRPVEDLRAMYALAQT